MGEIVKTNILLSASMAVLAMASSPAYAAAEASAKVDEIIVTATKRAQTLQEVPISLAAVTGDTLAAQAIRQFTDLQSMVPNLQIDQTNGNYAITIRGLGPGPGNLAFEQSVGLFVDGVYSSRARSLQTAFLDVERIEVVRGPQGALFGKNTNAGAISVISRAPSHDYQAEVRAGAEMAVGGWSSSGFITGGLSDKVSARLSVLAGSDGAYIHNRLTKKDEYSTDYRGVRGQVRWDISPNLDATFKLEGSKNDIEGGNIVFNRLGTNALSIAARTAAGGAGTAQEWPSFWRTAATERPEQNNTQTGAGTATVNWRTDNWKFTSITSYLVIHSRQQIDSDVSALFLLDVNQAEDSNQFFQEIRGIGAIGKNLDISTGATYMKTKLKITQRVWYLGAANGLPAYQAFATRGFYQDGYSISPYVSADYRLSSKLSLDASVRYNKENKTANIVSFYKGTLPASVIPYNLDGDKTENLWDYSAKLQYKINSDAQVYLSYATGTKGGGFISNDGNLKYNILNLGQKMSYEPEKAKSWELGTKLRLLDGKGDLNIALFSTDFVNLQVSSYTGTGFTTGNAAGAISKGIEVESNWRPTANISFGASGSYLDATYSDYPGAACAFNAPVTCVAKTNNLKGYDLTRAPKWKGNLYLQLQGQVGENLQASARVAADYTDLVYYQSDMNPLNAQKAFTKFNARIGIKNDVHNWEIALVGRNLSNKVTFSQAFNVPLIGSNSHGAMINPARTVSLELSKRF
jgi:iron complex outermembrane receptor protein